MKRIWLALFALTTGLGATACSPDPTPTQSKAAPASPTVPPRFTGVQHPLPHGTALKNDPELYRLVSMVSCAATDGGWRAAGVVHNSDKHPRKLEIVVIFTDAQARAVDSATTQVSVSADDEADWSATRTFHAPPRTQCVVRAVRSAS